MANVFVTGMTGTGKTTFVARLLRETDMTIYAFSNKEEDVDIIERESGKKFIRVQVNDSTILKYLPEKNVFFIWGFITHENRIRFMDEFSRLLKKQYNKILYIDEVHEVLPAVGKYSKELDSLIAGARARAIHVILVTQRPQNLRKSVLNNCKWKVTFKLNEPNAIKSMVENMENVTEDDIKGLDLYRYIVYNAYTGEITK
jgi:nucleoside-triphosphatase THEP1